MQSNGKEHFVSYTEEFADVLGSEPQFRQLIETNAHEGPVYVPYENALYFTAVPDGTIAIKRLSLTGGYFPLDDSALSLIREPSNMANGMTLDREGRLIICEQGAKGTPARISRMDLATYDVETAVSQWQGLPFNSPNDVVVKSDGTIWFTDPSYGFLQGFKVKPQVGDFVYCYDPERDQISVVADSFNKPNGLAFAPDESILYINDSAAIQEPHSYYPNLPHHIIAFDVQDGRHLTNARLFAVIPGIPDGMKVDAAGRVYVSSAHGVQVFNPLGDLIGLIRGERVANFTFGGPDNNILYILSDTAVSAAYLQAVGAKRPIIK